MTVALSSSTNANNNSSNNNTKTIISTNIDMKLSHHVRNLCADRADPPTTDYVVSELRRMHREYARKDDDWLTKQVNAAIQTIYKNKRKASDDDSYDRAAQAHDELTYNHCGGGLNQALQQNYKKQTSDAAALEAATAPSKSEPTPKKKRKSRVAKSNGGGSFYSESSSAAAPSFLSPVARPAERYTDLGGLDAAIQELRQLVEYPILRPELYRHLGVDPPRGVLLRGPPGTGKSHLANAVAGQLGVPYFRVSAPELVSGMSGESEGRIRDLFQTASNLAPSLLFLDELDAIAPKRSDRDRGMEKRMVAQLLTCMDSIQPANNRNQAAVLVLAATNRPDSLDPALRRAGRFDKEIFLGVPDEAARERILRTMTASMRLSGDFDYLVLARKTPGFVGADVRSLAKEAAVIAINRIFCDVLNDKDVVMELPQEVPEESCTALVPLSHQELEPLFVTMADFEAAVPLVQPSSKREGFATVPDVSWDDIGALSSIREELTISVLEPIKNPEKFQALGLSLPAGVLLYGPPGCGKTLLAKAIARESGANFICVKGPELLDKYVGESERAVRLVFERARSSSPCIVFFDELDSLVPKRGSDGGGGGGVSERVVNQLLTELDGLESRRSVFVIGATNRPELIDPAMLRPGRLDRLLYVPLPTPADRISILKALSTEMALGDDVDMNLIGGCERATGYSGADCAALLREAGLAVLKEEAAALAEGRVESPTKLQIMGRHFDLAFASVLPSVSIKDQARYERIRDRMARARSRGGVDDHGVVEESAGTLPIANRVVV